jgi:hypothetical protein
MENDNIVLVSSTDTDEQVAAALAGTPNQPQPVEPADQADAEPETGPAYTVPAVPPPIPAPKLDDTNEDGSPRFATYEDWMAAHAEWTIAETDRRATERAVLAHEHHAIEAAHQNAVEEFKRSGHGDYDRVLKKAKSAVQQIVAEHGPRALGVVDRYTMRDADHGPAIIYHLAQNTDELKRIVNLPLPLQLAELGKLDATFGGTPSRRRSAAAPSSGYSDPDVVSASEYQQWKQQRNEADRARRGR